MAPPSEAICTAVGMYAATNGSGIVLFVALAAVGNFLGTSLWFILGRKHRHRAKRGEKVLSDKILQFLARRSSTYYIQKFENQGWVPLFSLRLIPVVRSIVSYPAGRSNLGAYRFSIASLSGITLWCSLWIYSGFIFGQLINPTYVLAVSLTVALLVWVIFDRIHRLHGD